MLLLRASQQTNPVKGSAVFRKCYDPPIRLLTGVIFNWQMVYVAALHYDPTDTQHNIFDMLD